MKMYESVTEICRARGHKYYPTVRQTTNWLVTTNENVLYCSRCGAVKALDSVTPYRYEPFLHTWTGHITTNTLTGSLWLGTGGPDSPDPL